jgi:hypothetical protein
MGNLERSGRHSCLTIIPTRNSGIVGTFWLVAHRGAGPGARQAPQSVEQLWATPVSAPGSGTVQFLTLGDLEESTPSSMSWR